MSCNVFKLKVRTKSSNESSTYEPTIPYVGDYYIKDFQYISSKRHNKNGVGNCDKISTGNRSACKLFVKLWLIEVMKGLKQFLYEGSLHGVKYIFEPSFKPKERLTWVIIVVISIAFCAVNIVQLFSKWTSTPFVNVIDSLPTPIWAIPFPSVVICPHLRVKLSYADVTRINDLDRFFAGLVCPQMKNDKIRLDRRMNATEMKLLEKFINQASPSCEEVIRACNWRPLHGKEWTTEDCCEKLFTRIHTDYGLCFVFNSLPLNGFNNETLAWQRTIEPGAETSSLDWDLDGGYPKNFPPDFNVRPWRIKSAGESHALNLELYLNSSEHQDGCDGNNFGFTLMVKSPADHVYTTTVIRLPMNKMTSIEIVPTTHKTDSSLRALEPNLRQCYFQNERHLEHFLFYSGTNCKQDILINYTKRICNCIYYNWPRKNIFEPICTTTADYNCLNEVKDELMKQLMYSFYVDSDEMSRREYGTNYGASCFPACNDILYTGQVFYSNRVYRGENATLDWTSVSSKKEITQMNVHFYQDMFLGQHRHAQYDDYYFAGAIGGLLSLFLGFSIISVAELVYFVILKPIRIAFLEFYLHNH
ncbi:pickpocket protein 28-like [Epargyreus clarus]|uniref:pickpocket protein 28-like n=1 Tax=Epargyreus clarus TaxID=520877 RepID=UPI003C2F92FB